MTNPAVRIVGALAAAFTAAFHAYKVPQYLREVPWVAVLFVIGALVLAAAAVDLIARPSVIGWLAGGVVAAGMLAGLLLAASSVGLFGFHTALQERLAVPSLVSESVLIVASVVAVGGRVGKRVAAA